MSEQTKDKFRDSIGTIDAKGKRSWIFPKKPSGRFYKYRTYVSWFLLLFLLVAPFVKVNGNQFLLFNILERRFNIFGAPFWPQDFYIFVLAMVIGVVFITLFTVMLTGFLSILKADAEEGTCVLKAANIDVFVIVWDQDDEGNKGRQIWQGRINQGESAKITAPHAHIRYSYNDQPDEDQPLSGDVDRSCNGGESILVP